MVAIAAVPETNATGVSGLIAVALANVGAAPRFAEIPSESRKASEPSIPFAGTWSGAVPINFFMLYPQIRRGFVGMTL